MTNTTEKLFCGTRLNLTGPLRVEILPSGRHARLTQPYRIGTAAGRIIEVPEGFETDFASVPRLFWRIVTDGLLGDSLFWPATAKGSGRLEGRRHPCAVRPSRVLRLAPAAPCNARWWEGYP